MAKKKPPLPPPTPEARDNIVTVLRSTAEPQMAKPLAKLLAPPFQIPAAELEPILEELAALGKLHIFPPKTAKGKRRYWDRDLIEFGRLTIRKILETKRPQPEAALRKALKGCDDAQCTRILESALAAHELWRHPPVGKSKKELLGSRPPAPALYLRDVADQLTGTVRRLLEAHVPRDEIRRALVQLVEGAGIPFGPMTGAPAGRNAGPALPTAACDLFALMRRIEPGADRGALVSARDLRRAARLEKQEFDRAALELARQGRLSLHRHDYPAALSAADRDDLIADGQGTYYVGLALRGGDG